MVQARTENNQIKVGVQQTSNITKVSVTDTNASNPVSAANNKAHIYERQAYQHSETAKTYADKAKQSAENSANSALQAEESANLILNDKGFIETTQSLKNINTVANNIDDVDYVANNAEKIEQIVEDLQNLGDTTNINIVATNIGSVNTTAENIEAVKTVSNSADNVNVVANNLTNINYVAENIEDIQTVEENKNLVLEKVEEAKGYSATASSQAVIATEQATKASQMANSASSSASGASNSASSALSSANTATEKANIAITNAEIAITNAEIATTQASNALSSAKNAKTSETNALTYQNNANSSANTASQKANEASQSANSSLASSNNSKIWAEGTDEEVQALGGEHSSKRWAELGGGVDIESKVSKSGDTMTGTLNFSANVDTADIRQVTTFNDVTIGEIPQNNYYNGFKTVDSQGKEFANVNCSYKTNGRVGSNFYVTRSDSGKSVSGDLGVAIDLGGESAYGYAPSPTEDSNTNHIATTEWCNKKFLSANKSCHELFDIVQKDHILSYEETQGYELLGNYVYKTAIAGSRYGYPDFYNKCLEEKTAGTATQVTLGENTVTMYINTNGHQFFDIADKEAIDAFYNATGTAWFYGVDTASERILLPRYDYVELSTKDRVPVVGNGMSMGLTNGTDDFAWGRSSSNTMYANRSLLGSSVGTKMTSDAPILDDISIGLITDPEYSGVEADLSSYLSKKYYYMVVGNTSVESATTEIIDVTTTENDTLPLFHNFWSKEDMTTTGCYVNASLGSWLSGNVYTTAYNTLVRKLGTGNVKTISEAYTDYDFVVNADDMTFRLPKKNGLPNGDRVLVEKKEPTEADPTWYNLYSDGWCEQGGKGVTTATSGGAQNVLLKSFADTNYTLSLTRYGSVTQVVRIISKEINCFYVSNANTPNGDLDWEAKGYADIESTEVNLYYKVANAVQNLELLDVAGVTAGLNTKISKAECPRYVVEVSDKSLLPSWYVVYNDGWCEQGGDNNVSELVFLKEFADTNYIIFKNVYSNSSNALSAGNSNFYDKTTTGAKTGSIKGCWLAMGYIN